MKINIRATIKNLVPEAFWEIVLIDDVEQYLIGDLHDMQVNECACTLTLEKKANTKDVQLSKCETPTVNEVLPEFLIKLKKQNLGSKAQRILILTRSKKGISFSELKHIEQQIEGIAKTVPIIFVTRTPNQNAASIQCLVATGKPQKRGYRLAYDLDDSLTRWPEQFSEMSRKNKEAKGFNLVISTRHELKSSSCFQQVYDREKQDIEDTGVDMDVLAHAWLDFDVIEKLFPFFDTCHWFDRCLWAKVFYCRLYRIDAYYADQQRNIDQLAKLAPDIRTISVSASNPPVTTFASDSKAGEHER